MAEIVGVSRNTVTKYINRYVETGRVYVLKPTGRPEKLKQEQAETLRDAALSNRFASHADLLASVNGIQSLDTKTVSRYLRKYGIKSRIAAQKTLLGPTERANRMEIARRNLCREESDFFRTIYVDEFHLETTAQTKIRVKKKKGERFSQPAIDTHSVRNSIIYYNCLILLSWTWSYSICVW